jgi:hypothetical protein
MLGRSNIATADSDPRGLSDRDFEFPVKVESLQLRDPPFKDPMDQSIKI